LAISYICKAIAVLILCGPIEDPIPIEVPAGEARIALWPLKPLRALAIQGVPSAISIHIFLGILDSVSIEIPAV
jgi:hypothetical protein